MLNFRLMKKCIKKDGFFLQSFWVRNDDVARHTELWHKITIIRMLQVIAFSLHLFFLPFISWAHKTFSAMLLIARPHLACASVADHLFADLAQWHQSSNGQTHLISWLYRKMNGFDFSFCYVFNELQLVKFVVNKSIHVTISLDWDNRNPHHARLVALWNSLINNQQVALMLSLSFHRVSIAKLHAIT